MVKENDEMRRSDDYSMRKSRVGNRYFKVDPGYDKAVYENTIGNIFLIILAFIVFYSWCAIFWWGCYSHGIRDITSASWLYLAVLITTFIIIAILIFVGHFTNKIISKYDRLTLEVNEESKKLREEEEKKRKREEALKEMKKVEAAALDDSDEKDNASYESSADQDENEDEEQTPESNTE